MYLLYDVFALPEKFNIAVTESDLDPKVRKYIFNDCSTCELSMRACNWNVTHLKKTIFDLIIRGQVLDVTVQRNVPRFCMGSICG